MVKLVDMPDLGSGAARRVGSSPIIRTKSPNESLDFFCGQKEREVYSGYSINVTENLIATDSQTLIFRIFESMAIFI